MWNARNGVVTIETGEMDYICFGKGERLLVLIPGVGDGLTTVKGKALAFAFLYRKLAKDFTVYVFSRRRNIPQGMTTRDMAKDLSDAMDQLGISHAAAVGVSQGGMIVQWLAIDHPDKVDHLVLVVTLSRPNDTIKTAIGNWIRQAERGDYKGIMISTAELSYSEEKLRRERIVYRILGNFGKPESFERFIIQAESCLTHDSYHELPGITVPTLVIGGTDDKIVSGSASEEIAQQIPGSVLHMYEGLGHGLYEEAGDFLTIVSEFCKDTPPADGHAVRAES